MNIDLREPLDKFIFASSRLEVAELNKLRDSFFLKYGNMYLSKADSNADDLDNINLVQKLKSKPAVDVFITIKLKQLYKEDKIPFELPEEIQPSDKLNDIEEKELKDLKIDLNERNQIN